MEELLQEVISDEELKKFERIYKDQKDEQGVVPIKAQFEYAWCLIRSKYPADIRKGIILLENLYSLDVNGRRDYLFYLSLGHCRIKEYSEALKYCRVFLDIEPANEQVQSLEKIIKTKMNKEGKIGFAITMAGVFVVGALVSLGVAFNKSKN